MPDELLITFEELTVDNCTEKGDCMNDVERVERVVQRLVSCEWPLRQWHGDAQQDVRRERHDVQRDGRLDADADAVVSGVRCAVRGSRERRRAEQSAVVCVCVCV